MGVQVSWDNDDKTVIRYDLAGRWQWEEFYPKYQQAVEMIAPLDHKVDFIVNPADEVTRRGYAPPNILSRLWDLNKRSPANVGTTYVIGSPLLKALYSVAMKVYPALSKNYVYVSSLEEARQVTAEKLKHEATKPEARS